MRPTAPSTAGSCFCSTRLSGSAAWTSSRSPAMPGANTASPCSFSTSRSARSSSSGGKPESALGTKARPGGAMRRLRTPKPRKSCRKQSEITACSPGRRRQNTGTHGRQLDVRSRSRGRNVTYSESIRPLIRPEEIMHYLCEDAQMIIPKRGRPVLCGRAIYFRRAEFAHLVAANRFFAGRSP